MLKRLFGGDKNKRESFYDYTLLFIIVLLSCFGLIMVYSSSSYVAHSKFGDSMYFFKRQGWILLFSFVGLIAVSKVDYHILVRFAVIGYITALILMVLVNYTPFGVELNGKKRWFGIAGHSLFQAAEYVKIAVIVALASFINRIGSKVNQFKYLFLIALLTLPLAFLVLDNNLSTGIIILGIAFIMAFVATKLKWPFVLMGVAVAAGGTVMVLYGNKLVEMGILEAYQFERIYVWQDPESYALEGGHQVLQGLYAIGSGGLLGKGLGSSLQKLGFVPEAQNDMIFSIICEELGLFGAVCVLVLFGFMIWRFMLIANNAPDLFGSMLVTGIMAHIALQVILNVAVVTNTIPNTGITLPFISYGGTSVCFLMLEMAIALSVSNQIKFEK